MNLITSHHLPSCHTTVNTHLCGLDCGVLWDLVASDSVHGCLDNVHIMPRLLPSLFGGTRARHDVLLYLEQIAISCRGREEGGSGRRKRREDRRSNTLWLVHHHVAMVTMSLPHIPQGMCVHCSSSVSVPALTSWTRVGAGGISVSRYQRSLQHTWEWVGER